MKIADIIDVEKLTFKWGDIEVIPQFAKLKECEQSPQWHSEGNAWKHTVRVCEEAINICEENRDSGIEDAEETKLLLAAALFHDIGKGVTTKQGKDGRWHAYGHEEHSEILTRQILWDEDIETREKVCALVRYHMEPLRIFERKDYLEYIVELSKRTNLYLLTQLKYCDIYGSVPSDLSVWDETAAEVKEVANVAEIMGCLKYPSSIGTKNTFTFNHLVETKYKKQVKVYLMMGLPGSGKSTIAKGIVENSNYKDDYVIVSRDLIRVELGFCKEGEKVALSSDKELKVTDAFNKKLLKAASEGKSIIIDDTNLKRKYRDAFKDTLRNYSVDWHYYYVEAKGGIGVNIERRRGQIDEKIIASMVRAIDWPTPSEYLTFLKFTT